MKSRWARGKSRGLLCVEVSGISLRLCMACVPPSRRIPGCVFEYVVWAVWEQLCLVQYVLNSCFPSRHAQLRVWVGIPVVALVCTCCCVGWLYVCQKVCVCGERPRVLADLVRASHCIFAHFLPRQEHCTNAEVPAIASPLSVLSPAYVCNAFWLLLLPHPMTCVASRHFLCGARLHLPPHEPD